MFLCSFESKFPEFSKTHPSFVCSPFAGGLDDWWLQDAQVPRSMIFVKKKGRRGVEYGKLSIWHHWTRIKFRWNQTCSVIRGLFTNEVLKIPEILQAGMFRVWFGLVMLRLSLLLGLDPFWDKNFVPISQTTPLYQLNISSFGTSETGKIDCTEDIELSK